MGVPLTPTLRSMFVDASNPLTALVGGLMGNIAPGAKATG